MPQKHCSNGTMSVLVRRFLERAAYGPHVRRESVIGNLIERFRRKRLRGINQQLQLFLRDRNIVEPELVNGLGCDGLIEPIGSTFAHGFRMKLNRDAAMFRSRFTLAHEACHTLFYELVPELKFTPHEQDPEEERLCNWGAAALLIPPSSIRRRVKGVPICLTSLKAFADEYRVSLPTMALRLRSLGLWNCQLSRWHRMTDGSFVLDNLYGGRRVKWEWEDGSILHAAWESSGAVSGRTFVNYEDRPGIRRYRPVAYEVRRCMTGVIALWGDVASQPARSLPLLTESREASLTNYSVNAVESKHWIS
jgi:hypothetical protein